MSSHLSLHLWLHGTGQCMPYTSITYKTIYCFIVWCDSVCVTIPAAVYIGYTQYRSMWQKWCNCHVITINTNQYHVRTYNIVIILSSPSDLLHWGLNKLVDILQGGQSYIFSWAIVFLFRFKFCCSIALLSQSEINRHWLVKGLCRYARQHQLKQG